MQCVNKKFLLRPAECKLGIPHRNSIAIDIVHMPQIDDIATVATAKFRFGQLFFHLFQRPARVIFAVICMIYYFMKINFNIIYVLHR